MSDEPRTDLPLVTEDELDLTLLVAPDRHLTVQYRDGSGVKTGRFPVRGSADIDAMMRWLVFERKINEAIEVDDEEEAGRQLEPVLQDAIDEVHNLLLEKTPGAPRPIIDVRQMLLTLRWLAGDASVADAVARALTAGLSLAKDESAVTTDATSMSEDGSDVEGEGRPLASSGPSSSISSG